MWNKLWRYFFGSMGPDNPSISVRKIWDEGLHNAFTDLIIYKNRFLLSFREGPSHCGDGDGRIVILSSPDGEIWSKLSEIDLPGYDLRDPMLSEMPDGTLMLNMGASVYEGEELLGMSSAVSFSKDGLSWSNPCILDLGNEWLWRVTWEGGTCYGAAYSWQEGSTEVFQLKLYKSANGIDYTYVADLDVSSSPNETTLRFVQGKMMAMVRRNGNGWIGWAKPPFKSWHWQEGATRFGGPNFLPVDHERIIAATRQVKRKWWGGKKYLVTVGTIKEGKYLPFATLPSGGDCGYPGLAIRDGTLYVSYYSTHEHKTSIYFATLAISGSFV